MITRPIIISVIACTLAFTAGLITATSWSKPVTLIAATRPIYIPTPTPTPTPDPETSKEETVFGNGRLKILSEEVHLKSERLFYEINVRYPQIAGSNADHIKKLNQRIRRFAVDRYQWPLKPSKAELRRHKSFLPEEHNLVDVTYRIVSATDSILSIVFLTEDYYIGAAHSSIKSYVINYDLKSHRELKLADFFKPGSDYLRFIASYCTRELKVYATIEPKAETFASWNFTEEGIQFNFDPCQIAGCSSGPQEVTIPFTALTPFFKTS